MGTAAYSSVNIVASDNLKLKWQLYPTDLAMVFVHGTQPWKSWWIAYASLTEVDVVKDHGTFRFFALKGKKGEFLRELDVSNPKEAQSLYGWLNQIKNEKKFFQGESRSTSRSL